MRSAAAEVRIAENRLEEYSRSSKTDGNQEAGRLTGNPVKTLRLSEKATGFIRSRTNYKNSINTVMDVDGQDR